MALALLAGACTNPPTPAPADPGPTTALLPLTATRGTDAALFDSAGRQVTLRGANFNQLGDYFQSDPRLPTVATLDETDWADAQALGFSIVRLVTTWSAWEPERDVFDAAYAAKVQQAVADANAHGMYVLVDLHQDAWSKFVFTPRDYQCPAGTSPQRGWDGAPEWATFTDGVETCTPGGRENSPAVKVAWDNFYRNRDGIQDEFAELWGYIGGLFAGNPGVAGFDLLNEPGVGSELDAATTGLAVAYAKAIARIRQAERTVAPTSPTHAAFVEPVFGGFPPIPVDFSMDENIVVAPHTYAESFDDIAGLLDLQLNAYGTAGRTAYRAPIFLGEYGAYRSGAFNTTWTSRVHRLVDQNLFAGDTWWQWEQACGDPHNADWPLTEQQVLDRLPGCGDARSLQACPTRPSPRAVPGRLTSIDASPCGPGPLTVTGTTAGRSTADLWFPSASAEPPTVTGDGLGAITTTKVPGGWRVFVQVDGSYRISLV